MKVYYSCSTNKLIEYKENYISAINTIKNFGAELTRDWLEVAIKSVEENSPRPERAELFSEVMKAIQTANVCIFDVTEATMALGVQTTECLNKGIPHLLLINADYNSNPNNLFIAGSKSNYTTVKTYSDQFALDQHIECFLIKHRDHAKTRLNLALDKIVSNFLDWKSWDTGQSKTAIIQELLRNDMASTSKYSTEY